MQKDSREPDHTKEGMFVYHRCWMTKTLESLFEDLDATADANLNARGVREYRRYKAELLTDGKSVEDIEWELRGFIFEAQEHWSDMAKGYRL